MKYIIIGLGNFGSSLGSMLTDLGHEVIGVDADMRRVEAFRDSITSTICLDCSDMHALSTLPVNEADVVVIAIGEDFGASVMTTALLIKKKAKRLICRSVSPIHLSVFQALGVNEIIHPEQEAAERLVKRITHPEMIDSYQVGQDHSIIEVAIPARYIGTKVADIDFRNRFQLTLISIIKHRNQGEVSAQPYHLGDAQDFVLTGTTLEAHDVLVLFGRKSSIRKFLGE